MNTLGRSLNLLTRTNRLTAQAILSNQTRNTHIVKRYKVQELLDTHPEGPDDPQRAHTKSDPRYIYETVRYTNQTPPQEDIRVLLLTTVAGLGNKGQVISIAPAKARRTVLLPRLGVYASPQNLERYKDISLTANENLPSSFNVGRTLHHLGGLLLWVSLSLTEKWTLQKWHIRASLRKAGVQCSEEAIELPSKPICGPNLDYQQKAFLVKITINQKESVYVRCLISHVTSDVRKKLPYLPIDPEEPLTPLFPEDAEYLEFLHEWRTPLRITKGYPPQVSYEQFLKEKESSSSS